MYVCMYVCGSLPIVNYNTVTVYIVQKPMYVCTVYVIILFYFFASFILRFSDSVGEYGEGDQVHDGRCAAGHLLADSTVQAPAEETAAMC